MMVPLLTELKQALQAVYGSKLRGVYVYGSRSRGDDDAESDLDIIIVLKDYRDYWEEVQRTGGLIADLSLKYEVSISPVRIREAEWRDEDSPFLNDVRQEAVPL